MNRLNRVPVWSVLAVLALVVLGVTPVRSQESAEKEFENSLVKGAWALQFQVGSNFTLRSFQGDTFSIKKHTSDGKAWRVGLSLDLSTEDADGVNQIDGQGNSESDDASYEGVGLTIQRVFYPAPRARVSLYYGLGMRGFFSHQKVRVNHPTSDTTGSMWTGTNNHWSAGVAGILGVEWFATKSLSLTAEYGSTVRYHYYKNRTERFDTTPDGISKSTDESSNQGFDFGSDDVRLGLSVYF